MNEKRCEHCKHMRNFGGPKMYCFVGVISHPCTYMRDRRSLCGPDGDRWEKRDAVDA